MPQDLREGFLKNFFLFKGLQSINDAKKLDTTGNKILIELLNNLGPNLEMFINWPKLGAIKFDISAHYFAEFIKELGGSLFINKNL